VEHAGKEKRQQTSGVFHVWYGVRTGFVGFAARAT